jgi:hypothetical protein
MPPSGESGVKGKKKYLRHPDRIPVAEIAQELRNLAGRLNVKNSKVVILNPTLRRR